MNLLGWMLFGLVVGLIARAVVPGKEPASLAGTVLLGMAGALIGGWVGQALGWYGPDEGAGFVAATLGAVLVLLGYNAVRRRRKEVEEIETQKPSPPPEQKAA